MHVIFVEPAFPRNQREFPRALRQVGARVTGIGEAPIQALPDELRFTVAARFWRGLPVREIARLEGVTGAAIRKRLKKALALLADELTEEVPS